MALKKAPAAAKLHFAIDGEPTLLAEESEDASASEDISVVLSGWAFCEQQPCSLQLRLDGRIIAQFSARYPRPDVYQLFPNFPYSLICGFKLPLPIAALSDISAGRLCLFAIHSPFQGASETLLWQWSGAADAENSRESLDALISFFEEEDLARNLSLLRPVEAAKGPQRLAVVLEANKNLARFGRNLSVLKTLALPSAKKQFYLDSLIVLAETEELSESASELIKEFGFGKEVSVRVSKYQNFSDLRSLFASNVDSSQRRLEPHLVMYVSDVGDPGFLNLSELIEQYLELPQIEVLMPSLYGSGPNLLSGCDELYLGDLRRRCVIHGSGIPTLSVQRCVTPLWVCSFSRLLDIESKRSRRIDEAGVSRESSLGLNNASGLSSLFRELNGGELYHCDLRQPLLIEPQEHAAYNSEDLLQMQAVIDAQFKILPDAKLNKKQFIFLLPKNWRENDAFGADLRQLIALADVLRKQACSVVFASDDESMERNYLGGYSVTALNRLLVSGALNRPGWIVAASWEVVRTANALSYISGLEVVSFFQEAAHLNMKENGRENYQLASWAAQGTDIHLASNPCVAGENKLNPQNCLNIGHQQAFRSLPKLPVSRRPKSILFVMGPSVEGKDEELLQLFGGLRAACPELQLSVVAGELSSAASLYLRELVDDVYQSVSAIDAHELLAGCELLCDCSGISLSSLSIEAVLRGAVPVLCSRQINNSQSSVQPQISISSLSASIKVLVELLDSSQKRSEIFLQLKEELKERIQPVSGNFVQDLEGLSMRVGQELSLERSRREGVSVIVPVYCALDATVQCLRSLLESADDSSELIVVNDVSDAGTTAALDEIAAENPRLRVIHKEVNGGFVQSCWTGVRAANPKNDIVLLNSDVVLTKGSLQSLQNAAYSRCRVGIASALSTNSPHLQIDINTGDSLFSAAKKIRGIHKPEYPTVITPEGQLIYIRRWAMDKFGFFDSVYNRGFCEESDMCMRMFLHGVDMVVADDALIAHRKSESFGLEGGLKFKHENRPIFDARWGRYYSMVYPEFLKRDPLNSLRSKYKALQCEVVPPQGALPLRNLSRHVGKLMSAAGTAKKSFVLEGVDVVFVLPSVILGGGTLSVLQHVNELLLRGIEARVLSFTEPDTIDFPLLAPPICCSQEQFFSLNWSNQRVAATFWLTAYFVQGLKQICPDINAFYYIQDYEPWFYSRPENYPTVCEAEKTYEFGLKSVAKTQYLCDTVSRLHGVGAAGPRSADSSPSGVELISPGVARTVFYPGEQDKHLARPRLVAYYRPRTPRRGGAESLQILVKVKQRVPEAQLMLFGEDGHCLEEYEGVVEVLGRMPQGNVAKLYRNTDIVLDMSFWHGFGRMGIESMASGAVPVLTDSGGVRRYAEDGRNCFLVTHADLDLAVERIVLLLKDRELRLQMREHAIATAERFSEPAAVDDWLSVFGMAKGTNGLAERSWTGIRADVKELERKKVANLKSGA